ncbi:hypothetical protein DFH01_23180 [Falsiroseomonas bella]|uniref:DUF1134 domain-containing protein n=1 Tax=Falsiroseomonas bella TaxID=2184016 RepID=A0A317F7U5_9PROT|nr:hypothetical protein [Falsiroseomonas bella]PWS35210.1 hypothetical protein DFH01_23180 [Falsiroseomonas bella]
MTRHAPRRALLTAAGALFLGAAEDPNPDASLWIEEVRIGLFGRSGAIGGGRLRYQGEVHAFAIEGLSAAGAGVSTVRAQGEVFNLRRLSDFPGTYTQIEGGRGAADGPVEVHSLRNQRGVRLRLRSARAGATLRIGEGGLVISLEE